MAMPLYKLTLREIAALTASSAQIILRKIDDGRTLKCADAEDLGKWGYAPLFSEVTFTNSNLNFNILLVNLECSPSADPNKNFVAWTSRKPYTPITDHAEDKTYVGEIVELQAVLIDEDSLKIFPVTLKDNSLQNIKWSIANHEIAAQLAQLQNGQELTKNYYFQLRSKILVEDRTLMFSGGAYVVQLRWRKVGSQINFSSKLLK